MTENAATATKEISKIVATANANRRWRLLSGNAGSENAISFSIGGSAKAPCFKAPAIRSAPRLEGFGEKEGCLGADKRPRTGALAGGVS